MFNAVFAKVGFNECDNLACATVGKHQVAGGAVSPTLATDAVHPLEQVAERIGWQVAGRGAYLSRDVVNECVGVGVAVAAECGVVGCVGSHRAEPPSM